MSNAFRRNRSVILLPHPAHSLAAAPETVLLEAAETETGVGPATATAARPFAGCSPPDSAEKLKKMYKFLLVTNIAVAHSKSYQMSANQKKSL